MDYIRVDADGQLTLTQSTEFLYVPSCLCGFHNTETTVGTTKSGRTVYCFGGTLDIPEEERRCSCGFRMHINTSPDIYLRHFNLGRDLSALRFPHNQLRCPKCGATKSQYISFKKDLTPADPSGDKTLRIGISNLKGGHSGIDIDKGRLNGIAALGGFLNQLEKEGVVYELSSFKGGCAGNAIPSQAEAVIVISAEDQEQIGHNLAAYCEELNEQYKDIENEIQCEVMEMDSLPKVVSSQEKEAVVRFITETFTGVYAMSDDMEGLVQSSANFGVFKLDPEEAEAIITVRSSDPDERIILLDRQEKLAQECGFETTIDSFANAWKYDPDSRLTELAKTIYREQNGEDICVLAVHAGLECGCFKEKNPDLDMISIGPDLKDVHTPNEVVYLNSIPKTWHLLEGIFASSGC